MLHTRICDLFGIEKPIVNAPMASGAAGGELAAAVSEAGGLGLIGAIGPGGLEPLDTPGRRTDWLAAQIRMVRERTNRPFGVGFITHWLPEMPELYEIALKERVPVIAHSFADPSPYVPAAIAAGAKVICQVQTVAGAIRAAKVGVNVIVAQGTEAGGHTGSISTLTLVPQVCSAVAPLPVIAAGGIGDGRGLAAALMLGAEGAWMGTAFLASPESGYTPNQKRRVLEMSSADTILTRVFDIALGLPWPEHIAGRASNNAFTDQWHGREQQLKEQVDEAAAELSAAARDDDVSKRPVWAGEGVGYVTTTRNAGDILRDIVAEAERVMRHRYEAVALRQAARHPSR